MKVAFIGLGVMGYPMAGHLVAAGFNVSVYNRTTSKAEQWCDQFSGESALTPAAAAKDADIVFACVGDDDDIRSVTLHEQGAFAAMAAGSIFVDHTTTSAQVARELAEVAATSGIGFMDAPVSGGQVGAETGALTVMVGGEQEHFDKVVPVISSYAKSVKLMGCVGNGQLTKMVNQICIAGIVQGLTEGIAFAEASGLDGEAVIDVISKGAAQSWQMENRHQAMLERRFDFGFAVDWMRKDLRITIDEADRNGTELELTRLVDRFYSEVQALGGGRWDTCSLIARLQSKQH